MKTAAALLCFIVIAAIIVAPNASVAVRVSCVALIAVIAFFMLFVRK